MKAVFFRLLACAAAMLLAHLLWPGAITLTAALLATLWLWLFYLLLRPVLITIALPFNLFCFGLLTPLADALFVLWAGAWTQGMDVRYWQCILIALLISACYAPYTLVRRRDLLGNARGKQAI